MKINMQRMFDEQNKSKIELKYKIGLSFALLSKLNKKTTDGYVYENVAGEKTAKGEQKVIPVDFNSLLNKFRVRIVEIHMKHIGHGEVQSKKTLQLLNEIELFIID